QEICDRVGILAHGILVREGCVQDLLAIENQTELILENASPEVLAQISALLDKSSTHLIEQRRPQTTLERLFLDATHPSAKMKTADFTNDGKWEEEATGRQS